MESLEYLNSDNQLLSIKPNKENSKLRFAETRSPQRDLSLGIGRGRRRERRSMRVFCSQTYRVNIDALANSAFHATWEVPWRKQLCVVVLGAERR